MEFAGLATQELTVSSGSLLDAKERVKQAVDIVDLVGSHIQLRRQGRNYVGLCPWHDDSRPSLQVNPERQSFKCWVCDIGGDVFSFVMHIEGVEFREALQMLADRVGITLDTPHSAGSAGSPKPGSQSTPFQGSEDAPAAVSGEGKRTLYKAMAWAESQYHRCLLEAPEAEPARKYLAQRGITAESIEQFHLGFSPNQRDWLLGPAKHSASRTKILETVGILARGQDAGGYYDRFRGRVLFSIRDTQGRPVGIGGRVIPETGVTSPAKYINSPETPLFSKSNLLYGLDVAREGIRKTRRALVMEGYTDCIVAHQYGFTDAVAVLGTALGDGHIKILKRFADRIVLVLDGDEAGQRRTNEVLELFIAQQVDLRILTLPEGADPCEFLQAHGTEAFARLLAENTLDALEHAFQTITRGVDLQRDVHGASQALERLVSIVAKAPRLRQDTTLDDRFREQKILQRLAALFRVDEKDVRARLTELRRRASRPSTVRPQDAPPDAAETRPAALNSVERELLELLIRHPECLPAVRENITAAQLAPGTGRLIYETCCRLADSGVEPTFERLMLAFDQPAVQSLLVALDEAREAKAVRDAAPAALVGELIRFMQQQEADRRRPAQNTTLREGKLDDVQETELLQEIIRQERNRQGISKPTDG